MHQDIGELKEGLKSLIVARLRLNVDPAAISDAAPLFRGGADSEPGGLSLDSVEALEIVVGIEERWGIAIQDESVANEFYSIDTLASLVSRLLSEQMGKAAGG